jgi:hypothetical protein
MEAIGSTYHSIGLVLMIYKAGSGREVHLSGRQRRQRATPRDFHRRGKSHLRTHRLRVIQTVDGQTDIRTADLAIGQRRPAISAESPFDKVRTRKNVGWGQPLDLIGRKSDECHEGAAGCLLAHATIADAGTVPRLSRPVSYSPALAAADIRHCLVTRFQYLRRREKAF